MQKTTTRATVRAAFKAAGYRVSFKSNPLNRNLCALAFQSADMLKPCPFNGVFGAETLEKHAAAFALYREHVGSWLEDTDQKIA